jgi:hypothetical protein
MKNAILILVIIAIIASCRKVDSVPPKRFNTDLPTTITFPKYKKGEEILVRYKNDAAASRSAVK